MHSTEDLKVEAVPNVMLNPTIKSLTLIIFFLALEFLYNIF